MMNKEDSMLHRATRKVVQNMIRKEAMDWPPECPTFIIYQPKRPDKPLSAAKEEPRK